VISTIFFPLVVYTTERHVTKERLMKIEHLQQGDAVYAAVTITNDGTVPGFPVDQVFAAPGTMGMLINTGHLEEDPSRLLYLVSFQNEEGELGPPVTCFADELATAPLGAEN
jgi:nitrogen fixation protein NifZ